MCNFHVCKWKNAYKKRFEYFKSYNDFYVFIQVKEEGGGGL